MIVTMTVLVCLCVFTDRSCGTNMAFIANRGEFPVGYSFAVYNILDLLCKTVLAYCIFSEMGIV